LQADTGEYVWHYQTTPGDEWDFDACSPMILADLQIRGAKRAVLMQAPKNGFFYVLDRATGQLISADAFTALTWAKGVDPKTIKSAEALDDIARQSALQSRGMVAFKDEMTPQELEAIRAYLIHRATKDRIGAGP
jgi:glucose dehydrogenase